MSRRDPRIQVSARGMDPVVLKKRYGDRLGFWGGIDSQSVLPSGTAAEVAQAVKALIQDAGENGGLIISAVHNIQPDVPPENVLALYTTAR